MGMLRVSHSIEDDEAQLASPPLTPLIVKSNTIKRPIDEAEAVSADADEGTLSKRFKSESSPEQLLADAFSSAESESSLHFEHIVRLIRPRTTKKEADPASLLRWISTLSRFVSKMQASASLLVDAILALDWCSKDAEFIAEYRHLLENLVSANASFVQPVLKMLVSSFRSVQVKDESPALLSAKFDHIHSILAGILHLIPSAPSLLTHIVTDNFPHKSESVEDNMWYLKNCMRIVSYAPVLQNSVWLLVIDKLVQIDVEIQTSLDNLDEDEYDTVLQHCFDFDGAELDSPDLLASPNTFASAGKAKEVEDDMELSMDALYESDNESDSESETSESADEEDSDDEDGGAPALIITDFREMAGKLDSMLQFMMQQVVSLHQAGNAAQEHEMLESFFSMLLVGFERTVLPTHKCRYTQFLYFKACSLSPKWCEAFLVFLAHKSFDASTPSIIRVSAIAYLSSFISRAAFLDTGSLLQCLRLLTAWALQYVEANETHKTFPDLKKDHVFYSVVQAILYIFCFRWQEIVGASASSVSNQGGYGQLPVEMTGFQRIVMSKFSPLQICAKSIVTEFARITHKLDILYCYNLMNKKSDKESSSEASKDTQPQQNQQQQSYFLTSETLEAYFPFDPCNLQMTRKFIQDSYAEWKDEEEEAEKERENKLLAAGSFGSDFSDALSTSLNHILSFSSPRGVY
ncbi:RNA polymerase I-specific transcription initiation factor RRN3 [Rhizoclosmatium globosum]|uniref:RNA polymerase I-specific transcription initiation factor RRN3 n=1 Tax=Rhizoclosmatium globosum TaxID=329046 RepID=A0A1Y2CZS8_9FUNG|nr:RNA polymerase I-specific transcription initiation factor RRN3 [Rhizoclosmatium globosum]|eukprot:ORY52528.1 RNA polymerase I-specific transcription initiation factor RRN3 [Rhizoclosmatium globosum]